MTVQVRFTGSDELEPICFVEGVQASQTYSGASIRKGGPCPICRAPVDNILAFNPTSGNYFFSCPVCGVWVRWCSFDGTLVNEFTVVSSQKTTPLDQDLDDFTPRTGTF